MSLLAFILAVLATGFVLGAGFGFYIGRGWNDARPMGNVAG